MIQSQRFCKWPWILNWSKWILVVDIPTQILLTVLLSIDPSSRCKLKVWALQSHQRETIYDMVFFAKLVGQWKSKEWAKYELECLLLTWLKFIYSHSKFKVICKNADFECRYIRTHTKEKPSKISNIAFAILPFHQKKYGHTLDETTTLDETISCPSKWIILT